MYNYNVCVYELYVRLELVVNDSMLLQELSVNKAGASSRLSTTSLAKIWNSAIKRVCQLAILKANNSENLHISVSKLSQHLKKWTDK